MHIEPVTKKIRVNSYHPTSRQVEAHRAIERYPLYGGAMGGGKTAWLCNSGIEISMRYKNNRGFICRHELSSFMKTTYLELEKWLGDSVLYHNKQYHFFHLRGSNSRIYYGGLGDDLKAIERLKGLELGWFGIDQVEDTTEKHFLMLASRFRLNIPGIVYKGFCTANPTDNWVKDRWINKSLEDHIFIPAFPKDNPYNPPNYEDGLREVLPPELVKAWVEGDWTVVSEARSVFPYSSVHSAMYRESKMMADVSSIGVDVARHGDDETVICKKAGNKYRYKVYRKKDTMETADLVMIDMRHCPFADVKIDAIGEGAGVFDKVKRELKEGKIPEFKGRLIEYKSSGASSDRRYKNRRAEDYFLLSKDLESLDIPQDPKLRTQMTIRYIVLSSDGLVRIESKEDFKKRAKMSPDRLDAIVMAHSQIRQKKKGRIYIP